MRGIVYRRMSQRFFAMALSVGTVYLFELSEVHWVKGLAEQKITEFTGRKFDVKVGGLTDGIFKDMVLENVEFSPSGRALSSGETFCVDRMEISYRLWEAFARKFKLPVKEERSLKYITIYFSKENPFVRGFVKFYGFPDRMELIGYISPVFLEDLKKRAVKGVFYKREDGKYAADIIWNGEINIKGILDPAEKGFELEFLPLAPEEKGIPVKISGKIDEKGELRLFSRLDKAKVRGQEVMADVWFDYADSDVPLFSAKVENLIINKQPYWNFSLSGSLYDDGKRVFLREFKWGENFSLSGRLDLEAPYNSDLKIMVKDLDLRGFSKMMGQAKLVVNGVLSGEIALSGPLKTARLNSRLSMGEGFAGNVKFSSAFANLKGRIPVIKVVDGRVVKEGEDITMGGEIDFRKIKNDEVFKNVTFKTESKVNVWESWEILKKEWKWK